MTCHAFGFNLFLQTRSTAPSITRRPAAEVVMIARCSVSRVAEGRLHACGWSACTIWPILRYFRSWSFHLAAMSDNEPFEDFAQEFEDWQRAREYSLECLAKTFLYPLTTDIKNDPVQVCCAIEQAYWFSIKEGGIGDGMDFISFTLEIFHHVNFLQKYKSNVDEIVSDFEAFKSSVPTYGTVILNVTLSRVLLVKNIFNNWSFPMGKIMKGESQVDCAIRETFEETSLDMRDRIDMLDYLECNYDGKRSKVFVIRHTESGFKSIKSRCLYEIIDACWFKISALPWFIGDDVYAGERMGFGSKRFRRIIPFMKQLAHWIAAEKARDKCINEQETRDMKWMGLPLEFQ